MVQTIEKTPKAQIVPYQRRKFTREEYYRLAELGFFEKQRVELIEGEIIVMTPVGPEHSATTSGIAPFLWRVFGEGCHVRVQAPLTIGENEPEPDFAVVRGRPGDFKEAHPTTAVLVIEVAATSLEYDRTIKASLYASAGIPDYWVLNLEERRLEVYREPTEMPDQPFGAGYRSLRVYLPDEEVSPLETPEAKIKVSDLFV